MASKDFNDDKKESGELGSGPRVTAIYEIIPVGVKDEFTGSIDSLKYQSNGKKITGDRNGYRSEFIKLVEPASMLPTAKNSR